MTPDQITALAATGESEVLEFKSTTGTRREALRTVCAMLNQRGGHVLFGVAPTGNVVGQQVSERTIEEVSAEIQKIDPPAFPAIEHPLIARTFYRRGIIEEWGRGTLKMAALTATAGLPRPEIEDAGGCVTVRFRHGHYVPSKGDHRADGPTAGNSRPACASRWQMLCVIAITVDQADNGLALREIRARLEPQASERQVQWALEVLRNRGLAVAAGRGRVAQWKRVRGR